MNAIQPGAQQARPWSRRALRGWPWLLWAVLCVVLFWEALWAPADHILAGNDLASMFRVWMDYARSQVGAGELPLWNPYLFSGVSFISDPQPALFYPPTWLGLVMLATRALGLILTLHVWWAAVGATGWLRSEGASWAGALAGAAVFAFGGYTFARVQAGHLGVLTTGAWLPWGLWALRALKERIRWRTAALGAVCVGMAILAGHTATFVYVALMWGVYTLYLADRADAARLIPRAAVMVALGVALAAVQLLPFLQYLSASTRLGGADYEFASRFSWPAGYLVTLLVPNFFGEPVRTGYWGEGVYDELIFYVGVLPLLLALVAWRVRGRARFWLAVCGGALLLAFGGYGVLHRVLFRLVPFFSAMRAPARAGLLFTLGAAALTALGLSSLERESSAERRRLLARVSPGLTWAVLGGVALVVVAGYGAFAWGRDSNPAAGRLWHMAGQVATFGLFFALSAAWLRSWAQEITWRWLPALGVALILLDLWTLGMGLVQVVPAPPSAYWNVVAKHTDSEVGRVLPWGLGVFEQNEGMPFRVRSVFGYNPLEDQAYSDFVSAVPDPRAKAYDLLNVAYVITKAPLELSEADTLTFMAEESGVYIYRRSTAMPRAWIASEVVSIAGDQMLSRVNDPGFDPGKTALVEKGFDCSDGEVGEVRLLDYSENELVAQVGGDGGLVVFSERFAPGWRATVDGEQVRLHQVDGILRGVCAPAGDHVIRLCYRPASLSVGAALSAGALTVLLLLFLLGGRGVGRRDEAEAS
jgi:hypothetical protein